MNRPQLEAMDDPRFPLDDPHYAAFAWARFKRLLGWMAAVAAVVALVAVGVLWWWLGMMALHMAIATALGVFFTILLAAALMGLMFLSSGSGHDEKVDAYNKERVEPPEL